MLIQASFQIWSMSNLALFPVMTLLAAFSLQGCAGRPNGVLEPVAEIPPYASKVDILTATTRAPSNQEGVLFSGERDKVISLTEIGVSIPPDERRQIGEIQWPKGRPADPSTEFATIDIRTLTPGAQEKAWLKSHLPRNRRVLVFVHGFNTRFEEAVYRFAQIVHDSKAEAAPVLFTWPSRGDLFNYAYDRESSIFSRDALENVLNGLVHDQNVGEITVLAHSMGSLLLMETLRQIAIRNGRVPAKIQNVILASPDLDVDVFATQWRSLGEPRPKFALFISRNDRALELSRRLAGDIDRLGLIDPEVEPYKSKIERAGITVVDMTKGISPDALNHGKFADNPEIVRFLGTRLINGQDFTGSEVSLGERIGGVTMGVAQSVGGAAGLAINAPLSVIDANTRDTYAQQFEQFGKNLHDTAGSATGQ